ncbi:MAG TPA: hypothetical protein VHY83_11685 [Solirubrobacteraceae bacterium]|jgi:hypothetical protein|nr:hypothetical protein [Solirubrobacteraceae bacterium]
MRPLAVLAVLAGLALPAASASAAPSGVPAALTRPPLASGATEQTSTAPVSVPLSDTPPAGRRLSPNQVLAIAAALPKVKSERAKYRGSFGGTYLKSPLRWQVSFFSSNGKKEIAQVFIDDASGRVLEQWTGFQVPWSMARGYPGAFGRHVNALYVWLPLCLLFALPFFNFRRPLSLTNLDLLALLSFSVSLAFFNHANIWASVPLVYPPLLYLLARMLALLRRRPARAAVPPAPLRLLVPASWLAVAVVFLLGFRIALNVTDANVIDVGYAGVIGAQRITHDRPLYGSYPSDNERGDTYGPFNYEAYVPFEQVFGWSGTWDDLPAAHAAAIAFDLIALALLFWLGRRLRGPTLGIALAYAWVSYPFTLYSLESNANDSLVAVMVIAALLSATYRSRLAPAARGAFAALAGLTKFAPLALAPVLATHELIGERRLPLSRRAAALALFGLGFLAAAALALVPALTHDSLHTIYERTIAYQANRGSPFSVWGLYGGLGGLQLAVQIAAVVLALALALIPRRADVVGLAAACGAIMIAVQLGIEHWFYLYIPWFFPLVLVALLGRFGEPARRRAPAEASAPARSTRPVAAVST